MFLVSPSFIVLLIFFPAFYTESRWQFLCFFKPKGGNNITTVLSEFISAFRQTNNKVVHRPCIFI